MMAPVRRLISARTAMLASLAIMCLNYAGTSRWAHIPGSLHGPKQPIFIAVLILTASLALMPWPPARAPLGRAARLAGWTGVVLLAGLFFVWFPPAVWTQIPFLDNWPARYLSTMQGIDLLKRGAVAGWQWYYLGGYHLSSDVTQSLSVLALVPVWLFGSAPGFHLLHLLLFLSLPLLVFWDLSPEDQETRQVAAGLTAIVTAGFSYLLLRSGDTNSLGGVACTMLTLVASRAAARGLRWGGPVLLGALVLLNYVHAGFLLYAVLFLVVEALFYRDRVRLVRALLAAACAFVAGLPQYWESWRYPHYFVPNNVMFDPGVGFDWAAFARKMYYNVELLWLPGRWVNDFTGLAAICLPITVYVAWRVRSRAGLYAWIALATTVLLRFNTPEFAYLFLRPVHMLAVCLGPVLAVFLSRFVGRRALVLAFLALVAAYLQILVFQVPHVPTLRDANPSLVDRVATLDGALVLLENTPHRDMDADPARTTQPTPFGAHVEQVIAAATGRRLYAGLWDGWQWSPYRDQLLAGGAFRGRAIAIVPVEDFTAELRKWGIRHLVVWSRASLEYLREHPTLFAERWSSAPWHQFEYLAADTRNVWASAGAGTLTSFDPLGGTVQLDDVRAGAEIIVRTNYYPAWTARVESTGEPIALHANNGQLAFPVPKDGSYRVVLAYPRRTWLTLIALAVGLLGAVTLSRWPVSAPDSREPAVVQLRSS
jgi:hypothetical protein